MIRAEISLTDAELARLRSLGVIRSNAEPGDEDLLDVASFLSAESLAGTDVALALIDFEREGRGEGNFSRAVRAISPATMRDALARVALAAHNSRVYTGKIFAITGCLLEGKSPVKGEFAGELRAGLAAALVDSLAVVALHLRQLCGLARTDFGKEHIGAAVLAALLEQLDGEEASE